MLCGFAVNTSADDYGNITLFGQMGVSDALGSSFRTEADIQPAIAADILYSFDGDYIKVLAEVYIEEDYTSLERLILGLKLHSSTTLWLGKFHSPVEYWLNEYHRGAYTRISLTEPNASLVGFNGGITSQALSGVKVTHNFEMFEDQSINLTYGVVDIPKLTSEHSGADALDFFQNSEDNFLSYFGRLDYHPWGLSETEFGVAYIDGNVAPPDPIELIGTLDPALEDQLREVFGEINVTQRASSAYANIEYDRWRLLLSYTDSTASIAPATPSSINSFPSRNGDIRLRLAYVHCEYKLNNEWTLFGRHENSTADTDEISGRVILMAIGLDFDYDKSLIGARWDVQEQHALTLQYTKHDNFDQPENMLHFSWTFFYNKGL
jgi:hypothetical protein